MPLLCDQGPQTPVVLVVAVQAGGCPSTTTMTAPSLAAWPCTEAPGWSVVGQVFCCGGIRMTT